MPHNIDIMQLQDRIVREGRLCTALLTAGLPGTGGVIKGEPEDFQVIELPLYAPSGSGTHTYFGLRKRGIDTKAAIRQVAKAIGANDRAFGYAGLKDAQAVTEQTLSIEHLTPAQEAKLEKLDTGTIRVIWTARHGNKLKSGHLAGNRFVIRLRELPATPNETLRRAKAILKVLAERGVPNYFGPQRFGNRGDNWLLGMGMLRNDPQNFLDALLGGPRPDDSPREQRARDCYDKGDYAAAREAWGGGHHNPRAALSALLKNPDNKARAMAAVDKFLKRFTVNALQSAIFNAILEKRLDEIDSVQPGDLAVKSSGSAAFTIEAAALEQERQRARAFEISATAPLFGSRCDAAAGRPGEIELETLAEFGLAPDEFQAAGGHLRGERRPMRFPLGATAAAAGNDPTGDYLELSFVAPPGCYATSVLREIIH